MADITNSGTITKPVGATASNSLLSKTGVSETFNLPSKFVSVAQSQASSDNQIISIDDAKFLDTATINHKQYDVYGLKISAPIEFILNGGFTKIEAVAEDYSADFEQLKSYMGKTLKDFDGNVSKFAKYFNAMAKRAELLNAAMRKFKNGSISAVSSAVNISGKISYNMIEASTKEKKLASCGISKDLKSREAATAKVITQKLVASSAKSISVEDADSQRVSSKSVTNAEPAPDSVLRSKSYIGASKPVSAYYGRSSNSLSLSRSASGTFRTKDLKRMADDTKTPKVKESVDAVRVSSGEKKTISKLETIVQERVTYDLKIMIPKNSKTLGDMIDAYIKFKGGNKVYTIKKQFSKAAAMAGEYLHPKISGVTTNGRDNLVSVNYDPKNISKIEVYKRERKYAGVSDYVAGYKLMASLENSQNTSMNRKIASRTDPAGGVSRSRAKNDSVFRDINVNSMKPQEYRVVAYDLNGAQISQFDEKISKISNSNLKIAKVAKPKQIDTDVIISPSYNPLLKSISIVCSNFDPSVLVVKLLKRNITNNEKTFSTIVGEKLINLSDRKNQILFDDLDFYELNQYEYAVECADKFSNVSKSCTPSSIVIPSSTDAQKVRTSISAPSYSLREGISFSVQSNVYNTTEATAVDSFARSNDMRDVFVDDLQTDAYKNSLGESIVVNSVDRIDLETNRREFVGIITGSNFVESELTSKRMSNASPDGSYVYSIKTSVINRSDALSSDNIQVLYRKDTSTILKNPELKSAIQERNSAETIISVDKPSKSGKNVTSGGAVSINRVKATRIMSSKVMISWENIKDSNIDFYHVERKIENAPWENLGVTNNNSFIDTNFYKNDKSIRSSISYKVVAVMVNGERKISATTNLAPNMGLLNNEKLVSVETTQQLKDIEEDQPISVNQVKSAKVMGGTGKMIESVFNAGNVEGGKSNIVTKKGPKKNINISNISSKASR